MATQKIKLRFKIKSKGKIQMRFFGYHEHSLPQNQGEPRLGREVLSTDTWRAGPTGARTEWGRKPDPGARGRHKRGAAGLLRKGLMFQQLQEQTGEQQTLV